MYRCALNPRLCIIRWPTEIPVIRCVRACRCWISVINYPSNSCVIGGPERTRRRPQGRETPDIGLGWISIRTSLFWAPIFAFLYRASMDTTRRVFYYLLLHRWLGMSRRALRCETAFVSLPLFPFFIPFSTVKSHVWRFGRGRNCNLSQVVNI